MIALNVVSNFLPLIGIVPIPIKGRLLQCSDNVRWVGAALGGGADVDRRLAAAAALHGAVPAPPPPGQSQQRGVGRSVGSGMIAANTETRSAELNQHGTSSQSALSPALAVDLRVRGCRVVTDDDLQTEHVGHVVKTGPFALAP